jgi:hypothetical protein
MTTNETLDKTQAAIPGRSIEAVFVLLHPSEWERDATRPFLIRGGSFSRFGIGGWWGTLGVEVRRPVHRRPFRTAPAIDTASRRYLSIKARPGHEVNFGPDCEISSDVVALIYGDDAALIGWGDDYGTVRHPDRELPPAVKEAAERFVEAASDLWAALLEN